MPLRIAMLAGTLGIGGAEKQLYYTCKVLHRAGAEVQVFSLTQGEHYETLLREAGIAVNWVGQQPHPLLRLHRFTRCARAFRPALLQSAHTFANLYVGLAGRWLRVPSIGAVRSNVRHLSQANGRWTPLQLNMPDVVLANSYEAQRELGAAGCRRPVLVLPNSIDLADFDRQQAGEGEVPGVEADGPVVMAVGRLVAAKRFDRWLRILARVRREMPTVQGVLVGDGPEQAALQALAHDLGLLPDGVVFVGRRTDVPAFLRRADVFLLTSDDEGFPNVLLEAMAAALPVVTTSAGDSARVVQDGETGYVVPFDDLDVVEERLLTLLRAPDLRRRFGAAGRCRIEQEYDIECLEGQLRAIYLQVARRHPNPTLLNHLLS